MELYLDFNPSLEFVRLKLQGGGTLTIDEMKNEHKEVLTYEIVNFILDHTPDYLKFTSNKSIHLLRILEENNVFFDENSGKLTYKM